MENSGNNERPLLCRDCGGECCRTRPGIEAPERYLRQQDPAGALASALESGEWVLSRHVGIPWSGAEPPPPFLRWREILYPRPATTAERAAGRTLASGEPSPCVFLTALGCRLAFDGRPRLCQSLEPWANGECRASWDQGEAAAAWLEHQAMVLDALRRASAQFHVRMTRDPTPGS